MDVVHVARETYVLDVLLINFLVVFVRVKVMCGDVVLIGKIFEGVVILISLVISCLSFNDNVVSISRVLFRGKFKAKIQVQIGRKVIIAAVVNTAIIIFSSYFEKI